MARYGLKMAIYQLLYILWVNQTWAQPQSISEAITFEPIKIYTRQAPQNDHLNLSFVEDEHAIGKKRT
jgi:hypothetical protein